MLFFVYPKYLNSINCKKKTGDNNGFRIAMFGTTFGTHVANPVSVCE